MFTFIRVGRPVSCADIKLQKLSTAVQSVAEYGSGCALASKQITMNAFLEVSKEDVCRKLPLLRTLWGVGRVGHATDVKCGILAIG